MLEILNYTFMQNALFIGVLVGMVCALLGVFLVLRRYALIGDGLAHMSFGGVALGLLLGVQPLVMALLITILGAILINVLRDAFKVHGDASIGMISNIGFAAGIIIVSFAQGFNVDLFSYLFGNILAVTDTDMIISIIVSVIVLAFLVLYYNELFYISFDEETAQISGLETKNLNTMLVMVTAITVVIAIRVVGVLLTSALIVFPAVASLQIARSCRQALFFAAFIAVISVVLGLSGAFYLDLPAGAAIVMINAGIFLVTGLIKAIRLR